LTAHVAAGSDYGAADGTAQSFTVTPAPWAGPAATGVPSPAPGSAQQFSVGESNDNWRLSVTHPGHAPVTFTGTITINAGTYLHVAPYKIEPGDTYSVTGRTIRFHFVDYGYLDGISFTTPPNATTITFTLAINGAPAKPRQVSLGTSGGHPARDPFTIHRLIS
jgi:hypothetical protein